MSVDDCSASRVLDRDPASGDAGHSGSTEIRILIENSEYWLRNNGDLAMLAVTIRRLRERWPTARIGVLTDSPVLLRAYFPDAEGITVFDEDPWAPPTPVQELAARVGPAVVGPGVMAWLRTRSFVPQKARGARRRLRSLVTGTVAPPITPRAKPHIGSHRAVRESTMLVVLGGGYITDADAAQCRRVFSLIRHAGDSGVPVAMVGQGLGPLDDPTLLALGREAMRSVEIVALRERRRGPLVADRLGVAPERVRVTGDDAIELAYGVIPNTESGTGGGTLGAGIGFCLRVAGYAPVDEDARHTVGLAVRTAAQRLQAPLLPLIIAEYRDQDRRSTLPLVAGANHVVPPLPRYVDPAAVAGRVSQCRVLVTGAYHLAVFALSQGIPVVALTSSEYYDDKFLGLGDMFGDGLTMIALDDPALASRLSTAIADAWTQAPTVRARLREAAREQIALSRAVFDDVFALVEPETTSDAR
ncbi:polysaccharide pyruvyl transferase family protein [Williamsia deligens]|uniref:Polysaccharide pyruvyl transferase family protein n=1 Tax=Williamsia deligens TaxID=321325 RepID=A0ABW3G321_9NOCA|nr:polysaccharide pyruvyl transferase family protein [Williamsia deligens]MCP2194178.1 Polysaccharide pyruvyl transferase [Williamsia deligens]